MSSWRSAAFAWRHSFSQLLPTTTVYLQRSRFDEPTVSSNSLFFLVNLTDFSSFNCKIFYLRPLFQEINLRESSDGSSSMSKSWPLIVCFSFSGLHRWLQLCFWLNLLSMLFTVDCCCAFGYLCYLCSSRVNAVLPLAIFSISALNGWLLLVSM